MALPADLAAMLGRLSAMRAADRDFVLAQLEPDATRTLLPLLEQFSRAQLSDGLQALVTQCARDDTPAGMTRRGAAALHRAAGDAEAALGATTPSGARPNDGGMVSRGLALLGLGG